MLARSSSVLTSPAFLALCVSGGLSLSGVLVGTGSVWHSVSVFVLVPGFVCGEQ